MSDPANPNPLPPWFRWLPGMLAVDEDGDRWRIFERPGHTELKLTHPPGLAAVMVKPHSHIEAWPPPWPAHPDLTDPATLGCLVALLREVSGSGEAYVAPSWIAWRWDLAGNSRGHRARTEGEALWAALDAAWAMRGGQ